MLVETDVSLVPGTLLTVALAALLPFQARLVRSNADNIGLRFVEVPQYVFR